MRSRSILQLRVAAFAAIVLLALGVAACGDSDDDGSSAGNGAATTSDTSSGVDDRKQVRAAVEDLYAGLADGDAKTVCGLLNENALKELEENGMAKEGACVESFQEFLDKAKKAGGQNMTIDAEVKSVEVTGDKAVVKVGFGSEGSAGNVQLEKIDGVWKLGTTGVDSSQ